jgi:predicted aspartyl protease
MMRIQIAAATLIVGLLPTVWAQSQNSLRAAYESNRIFVLRSDVAGAAAAPLFYKGTLAAAANQISTAVKELHSVINAAPDSDQAYEAHDLLGNMFFRNGMYQDAFVEIRAALKERPNASDAKQMLPIATGLNNLPVMTVASLRPSTLQIEPKSTFLPLRLDGHDAEFFFDTGAGISIIGESEAKELGIPAKAIEGKMDDASGRGVSGLRIALAKNLIIGGLHLQNVPFVVISDTGEPWNSLPIKRRGIIGIPVLLAMRTIRWKPTGSFELGFPGNALNLTTCNALFHNSNPVIDVQVSGKHLDFTLDTGAVNTDLNPAFAEALPALLKTGTPEKQSIEGLGGTTEGQSVLLPSVTLQIDGRAAVLRPAHVFTEHGNGAWAAGNLGMDILSQASAFTLDFSAMTLRLQ